MPTKTTTLCHASVFATVIAISLSGACDVGSVEYIDDDAPITPLPGGDYSLHYIDMSTDALRWQGVSSQDPSSPRVQAPGSPRITVSGSEVVMKLDGYFLESRRFGDHDYSRVMLPEHSPMSLAGYPELPKVRVNMIVPDRGDVRVEVIDVESVKVALEFPVLPSRGTLYRNHSPEQTPYVEGSFYSSTGHYPDQVVSIGDDFVMRDYRAIAIELMPFAYYPADGQLEVYTKLHVRVVHDGSLVKKPRESGQFSEQYQSTFANYGELRAAKYDVIPEPGRMIIIAADELANAVQPLAAWKNQRGIRTSVATLSDIGSSSASAIKKFISEEYNSAEGLTYVILVGDAPQLPTLKGGYENADCDSCYAMVAGSDYYPDLYVSRISARNPTEVSYQVSKFLKYETDPDLGNWYKRGVGVASSEGSPPDYQRADELRDALLAYGYDSVGQIYEPDDTKSELVSQINAGTSIVNYIGHGSGTSWGTTGMSVSDVNGLANGDRQPLIVDVSCLNGNFANLDTCYAESWMRTGSQASPAGAIAMYSSTTNAAWVPPTVMQKWLVNELLTQAQAFTTGSLYYGGAMQVLDEYSGSTGQQLVEQYINFGDCSLMVRTRTPRALQVGHPGDIPAAGELAVSVAYQGSGDTVLNGTAALSQGSTAIAAGQVGADGNAEISYSGLTGATVRLTVVAQNGIPYSADIAISGGGETPFCGDGSCNNGETCDSCEADCGPCGETPFCGDGSCNNGETCDSCEVDCGPCGGGDPDPNSCQETYSCGVKAPGGCWCDSLCTTYGDCCFDGPCTVGPSCGDGSCNGSEDCDSCEADCGPCAPDPSSCQETYSCAGKAPDGCWCDSACTFYDDCCYDGPC